MSEGLLDESKVDVAEPAIAETTPVTPTPQVTETSTPTPAVEPVVTPTFSFREAAKKYGFSTDQFDSDEAATEAFLNYVASVQQPKPAEPSKPEPEPAEEWTLEKHFSQYWDVPQYNPEWDDLLAVNSQTGQIEPKANVPWGVAQQAMNEYARWHTARAKAMRGLFEAGNPFQRFYEAALPALERAFAKRDDITKELSTREEENVVGNFERAHSEWLAAEEGQQFIAFTKELMDTDGLPIVRAMQIASRTYKPQPNGVVAQSAATPEPQPVADTSFVDDALAKAGHRPSGSASSTAPAHQGAVSADEVRSLFTTSFAKSQTAK